MLTKKIQETLGYKPRPKNWAIYSNQTQKILWKFLGNLQIQVEVNNKHDRNANLLGTLSKVVVWMNQCVEEC